jgi:predicted  nucleic acid-binding Zn-ribbon protein
MHEILVINCLHDAEREICALIDWRAEAEKALADLEEKVTRLEKELSELRRQKKDQESLALGQQPDHKSGSCSAIIEVN